MAALCLSTLDGFRTKVGAGHARKCTRRPLAASQVLCLPHLKVGKTAPMTKLQANHYVPQEAINSPFHSDSLKSPAGSSVNPDPTGLFYRL